MRAHVRLEDVRIADEGFHPLQAVEDLDEPGLAYENVAQTISNPTTDDATRAATLAIFEAFHRYLGVAVGEHLGYLFTAAWTVLICLALGHTARFPSWLSWMGIVAALGIAVGLIEPIGISMAGMINALSYMLWSAWLIALGVTVLRTRESTTGNSAM